MPDDRATQSFFLIAANHDRGSSPSGPMTDDRSRSERLVPRLRQHEIAVPLP
jgi:hypothetical protein